MNKQYLNQCEQTDIQLFYEFNHDTQLFQSIIPTKEKSQYDATAKTNRRTFAVELKRRNMKLGKFSTIMLEDYKYLELLLAEQFENKTPLYINFLYDGTVLIFNLDNIRTKPQWRNVDIKSEGYETMQHKERRYYLDVDDAVIYQKQDNHYVLIKKGGK